MTTYDEDANMTSTSLACWPRCNATRAERHRMREDERTPITAEELKAEILRMFAKKFAHRPLDMQTAQRASEWIASEMVFMHAHAVAAAAKKAKRSR